MSEETTCLQQLLKASAHNLRDQGASGYTVDELADLKDTVVGRGHGLGSVGRQF